MGLLTWILEYSMFAFISFYFILFHFISFYFILFHFISFHFILFYLFLFILTPSQQDWFCGGLNYQIEHHLFPTLPRHNLSAARPQVMKFCEEYGLPYRSEGMFPAVMSIFYFLRKMARNVPEVRKEVWGKKE